MADTDDRAAFFTLDGEDLVPAPLAHSPWSPDMLHGRLVGALAARALEHAHAEPSLHAARLTVDLFRNSPLVPLRVTTTRVRDGRRIRVADAEVSGPQGTVGRATVVFLRRGEQPPGEAWAPEPWRLPEVGEPPATGGGWTPPFDLWWPGERLTAARNTGWLRETHPLVEGESISPLVRAALAADFASPLVHHGTRGLQYINADYTLTLSRLPLGDVIGLRSDGHLSDEGVAVGQCTVYDASGPFGHCAVTAVANPGMGS
ncbi:hypothetical protein Misp01_18540 [Microtetraspora sp. NBRC 13810]|uniref:thioesterase family protein n=1 Tax=Microtetraspora sp. NBRC 13810 TaxID=3030990 RepID=UPI0024A5C12A|nr:thioesterase family protein [Microtetraspora sp. NBRC 13810]GLW06724.1 hypothetical protein Misp01_18540 [Microtetraspora sp. NBRC 13810]